MTAACKTQIYIETTPYYHCISRCVQRAYLCGKDNFSGRSYEHRKQWIVDRWCSLFTGHNLVVRYRAGESLSQAERNAVSDIVNEWRKRLMEISLRQK